MSQVPGIRVPSSGGAFASRAQVPPVAMPRSVFNLSRGGKTSFDSGLVVPVVCEEVLPGDTFRVSATILARLATLLYPLMDNLYLDVHYFFVPMRLVWDNAEKFFGAQDNPGDSTAYTIPQFTASLTTGVMGLPDYFGISTLNTSNRQFNCLQFRAYRRIWNEWYRDENLQNSYPISYGDGPDSMVGAFDLSPRNKRADYFTTALPWPQKGTAVSFLPDGVGVMTSGVAPLFTSIGGAVSSRSLVNSVGLGGQVNLSGADGAVAGQSLKFTSQTGLQVDFATLGVATINAFRQANAMQVYLERNARGGTRYVEYLKAQWGVTSSDARLQRTEYLGGGSAPVVVTPVAQQSAKDPGVNSLGDLGGIAAVGHRGAGFVRSFEEHGWWFCMVSVRADLNYQAGVPRQFKRRTVFDFANPAFAHIGEQPVYNYEIYYTGESSDSPTGVFGYQERFAEYKQSYNQLTGNMRSQSPTSYDVWHVAQEFSGLPTLGDTFIRENPAVDRVIATPFIDQWIADMHFDVRAARCLPVYGVPGLAGRF